MGLALALSGAVASFACASGTGGFGDGRSPRPPRPSAPSAHRASASWVFHPTKAEVLRAQIDTAEGQLAVDEGGTRWLVREDGPEPSAYGAGEPLVAVAQDHGGYLFLGRAGTVYLAETPLGPFITERTAPERWVDTVATASGFLGLSSMGRLFRSPDKGRSWRAEPADAFFVGLAADGAGHVFAVSVPEQWHWSEESVGRFQPLPTSPVGVHTLWAQDGSVYVESVLGNFALSDRGLRPSKVPRRHLGWQLPAHPTAAQALSSDVLLGRENVGFVRARTPGGPGLAGGLSWTRGTLGSPMVEMEGTFASGCQRFVAARSQRRLVVACESSEGGKRAARTRRITLVRGDVLGGPTSTTVVQASGSVTDLEVAIADSGEVALSGVCPESRPSKTCNPHAVIYVNGAVGDNSAANRAAGDSAVRDSAVRDSAVRDSAVRDSGVRADSAGRVVPAGLSLEGRPLALAFAVGTATLFAAVVREKDHHLLVGVKSLGSLSPARFVDLSRELDVPIVEGAIVRLLPGRGGLVGVSIEQAPTPVAVTMSPDGAILAWGRAPLGTRSLHGAGSRWVALATDGRGYWESLNGGLTWTRGLLPRSACRQAADCQPLVACSDAGCIFGDELTRLGWGGTDESSGASPEVAGGAAASLGVLPGFRCRNKAGPWQPLPGLQAFPAASDAALGQADWAQVETDWRTGEVRFVRAERGQESVVRTVGLKALLHPERYALHVSHQIEGAAALRYEVPEPGLVGGYLRQLEVAWDNRVTGTLGHGHLLAALPARRGDFLAGTSGVGQASPGLISVAGEGLYLRPHRSFTEEDQTYYFQGTTVETLLPARFPKGVAELADSEFVRAGGVHAPLFFSGARAEVVFALGVDPELPFFAARLLAFDGQEANLAQGVGIAYRGQEIGFLSKFARVDGSAWAAYYSSLGGERGLSEPVASPLKPDLTRPDTPCSAEARQSPRVVAPEFPGPTPRVVLERPGEEALSLVARRAVLFGTPQAPCVAAWDASVQTAPPATESEVRLLILPRETGVGGWAFRALPELDGRRTVSALPITCEVE